MTFATAPLAVLRLRRNSVMDMDPGILCFQHCGPKVFCVQLPNDCPVCTCNLSKGNFQLPPFRIPYPFVRAVQHPCCIVIKPTAGDFLHDYLNTKDLHIGVTTSLGEVVEFDMEGVKRNQAALWEQCLVVDGAAGPWSDHWDSTLQQVSTQPCWTSLSYDEDNFNCYTFVLTFLRKLRYGNLSEAAVSRTVFCENFIVPRTTAAGKYISLFRKLQTSRFYIYKNAFSESS